DDVVDAVEEAADMLVPHKIEEPIDPVREQARIILKAAEETARGLPRLPPLSTGVPGPSCPPSPASTRPATCWSGRTSSSSWRRRWTAWTRSPTPSRASYSPMPDANPAPAMAARLREPLDSRDQVTPPVEAIVLTYA